MEREEAKQVYTIKTIVFRKNQSVLSSVIRFIHKGPGSNFKMEMPLDFKWRRKREEEEGGLNLFI